MHRLITVAVTLAVVVGLSLGGLPGASVAIDHTDPPPSDESFAASDNITVWERSLLPLRADSADAAQQVPNADWRVRPVDAPETTLNLDPVGIYANDTPVTVTFDLSTAGGDPSAFGGEPVELIAAHVEETGDGAVPATVSDAVDLLASEDANANASFTAVTNATLNSTTGDQTFTYTPTAPGVHLFFLAINESGRDGFVVDAAGNVSLDGNVSIIGVEAIGVRKGPPSVSAPIEVVQGDSADFTVDARVDGANVKHLVVLYHEDTYVTADFVLELNASPSKDFDVRNNSSIVTSIDEVNGVASLSESISAFGVDVNDGRFSGTAPTSAVVEFVAESVGTDQPGIRDFDTANTVVLDGSAAGANTTASTTLTVQTFGNWSTGTYRWVYVAAGRSTEESTASTGTLTVKQPSNGDGGGGGGGGGGGAPPPGGGGGGGLPPPPSDTGPQFKLNVSKLVQNVSVGIRNATGRHHIPIAVPRGPLDAETGANLTYVNFTLVAEGDFDLYLAPGRGLAPPVEDQRQSRTLNRFRITHPFGPAEVEDVTITFQVKKATLADRGQRPANLRLYRYEDGTWTAYGTEVVGETPDAHVFESEPPGLSAFAIGTAEPAFAVSSPSLETTTIAPGDAVEVTGVVENTGEGIGTATVELVVDGTAVDSRTVELGPGTSTTVTFERTFDAPGNYNVAVGERQAGSVRVVEPSSPEPISPPGERVSPPGGEPASSPAGPPGDEVDVGAIFTATIAAMFIALILLTMMYLYSRRYE